MGFLHEFGAGFVRGLRFRLLLRVPSGLQGSRLRPGASAV